MKIEKDTMGDFYSQPYAKRLKKKFASTSCAPQTELTKISSFNHILRQYSIAVNLTSILILEKAAERTLGGTSRTQQG